MLCFHISEERNKYIVAELMDEEVFASEKVTCVGQVVGLLVARDQDTARRAAKLVKVQYQDVQPAIITIQVISSFFFSKKLPHLTYS